MRSSHKVILGLVIGALMTVVALWGVPLAELGEALAHMDLLYLLPVALLFVLQQVVRAWRQTLIVRTLAPEAGYWTNLGVLCMGFFCINVFPARLGEVVRPILLRKRLGIPIGAGFGAMFVERLFDLTSTLVILQVVLLVVELPSRELELFGQTWDIVALGQRVGSGLLAPVLIGVLGLLLVGRPLLARVERGLSPLSGRLRRLADLGLGFARSFVDGLQAVRQPGLMLRLVFWTAVTWGGSALIYTLLAQSLGFGDLIGYAEGLGVMVLIMLGTLAPAPPGFVGVYEAACRGALALFGVVGGGLDGPALAYALVLHWWTYLVQALTAWWFFQKEGESLAELAREAMGRPSEG